MNLPHEIALRVVSLPLDKQQEVFDFVEFLRARTASNEAGDAQPFRGMPVVYVDPTEPVASDDWEAAR